MDMQECKVFFPVETSRSEAEAILFRYYKEVKIDNFMEKREIGCNVVTFAVTTLPMKVAAMLIQENAVKRIDALTTFRACKTNECCGGG